MGVDANDAVMSKAKMRLVIADEKTPPITWGNAPTAVTTEYLWFPYVPWGEITICAGPPGIGKGLVASHLTACQTTGNPFPNGDQPMPGKVLWCETEDSIPKTVVPRLKASGANLDNVRFALLGDPILNDLTQTITENDVSLVVLSPLISFLPNLANANDVLQVRTSFIYLQEAIRDRKCAVFGLSHPNKNSSAPPLERILGSGAFTQVCRSSIILGEQNGVEARRLAHLKHSLTSRGKDLLYTIKSDGTNHSGHVWTEWSTAADLCVIETFWSNKEKKQQTALEFVLSWLTIHDGRALATDIYKAAHDAGISAYAVQKAVGRSKRIKATKDNFGGPWWWEIVAPKTDK